MGVSILILTKNEEPNIEACLDALRGFDDIVVLDSVSTDRTQDMARARGARVVERPFDNWEAHRTGRWSTSTSATPGSSTWMPTSA